MANWTNHEIRRLRQAHANGARPSIATLVAMFPRHTACAVQLRAFAEGRESPNVRWLRLAHEYFARREAETPLAGRF